MGNMERTGTKQKENNMKRITPKEAAQMMQCGEQQVRMMCQLGKIPGAFCTGKKPRRTYYIYDEQIKNLMKGG
mgnify:FL=1